MDLKKLALLALLGFVLIAVLSFTQAAPPSDAPGNILDRITELENRIDVLESQVADLEDQVAELQEQGDPGPALYFGEKVGKLGYTVHQAETDGFVVVYGDGHSRIWAKTDSDPSRVVDVPLLNLRFSCGPDLSDYQPRHIIMPVRAGDYWYVEDGYYSDDDYFIFWIPLIASE
jgi:hypothetical protein